MTSTKQATCLYNLLVRYKLVDGEYLPLQVYIIYELFMQSPMKTIVNVTLYL